jgi:hypothetical protein
MAHRRAPKLANKYGDKNVFNTLSYLFYAMNQFIKKSFIKFAPKLDPEKRVSHF